MHTCYICWEWNVCKLDCFSFYNQLVCVPLLINFQTTLTWVVDNKHSIYRWTLVGLNAFCAADIVFEELDNQFCISLRAQAVVFRL